MFPKTRLLGNVWPQFLTHTLTKTKSLPLKNRVSQKENSLPTIQIFRTYVIFGEGKCVNIRNLPCWANRNGNTLGPIGSPPVGWVPTQRTYCWWNPAPVEVGSLSQILTGFFYIPGGCFGFLPSTVSFKKFTKPFWWMTFLRHNLNWAVTDKKNGPVIWCLLGMV